MYIMQNEEEILAFFNKIDYNCDGYINWVNKNNYSKILFYNDNLQGDFCTYMQLELQERDDVLVHSKTVC